MDNETVLEERIEDVTFTNTGKSISELNEAYLAEVILDTYGKFASKDNINPSWYAMTDSIKDGLVKTGSYALCGTDGSSQLLFSVENDLLMVTPSREVYRNGFEQVFAISEKQFYE